MTEGMKIEGLREDEPKAKKKPGRPARATAVRPPLQAAADIATVRPATAVDSRREAEEYANKLLNSLGDAIDANDEFYIDVNTIPDGWTYEWKAYEITGKANTYHMNTQTRNGWRPVPAERHPEHVIPGTTGPLMKKGLMLMELPSVLVARMKAKEKGEAESELRNADRKLHDTPANTAPREEFPDHAGRKLGKEIMRPVSAGN